MKKNFLMIFAATTLMLCAVMFSSCSKDDDAVKANASAQNNPVAKINAFDEYDSIMSQYDFFNKLQPLYSALAQTDKPSK